MRAAAVPCEECDGRVREGDDYCTACGVPVSESIRAAIEARRAEVEEHEQSKRDAVEFDASRRARTLTLARWALLLLLMFEIGQGFLAFPESVRMSITDVAELSKREESYIFIDELGNAYTKKELLWLYARLPGSLLVGKAVIVALLLTFLALARRAAPAVLLAASLAYFALLLAQGWDGAVLPKTMLLIIVFTGALAAIAAARDELQSQRLRAEREPR